KAGCGRERERLRLDALRSEPPAAAGAARVEPDPLEVADELLDRLDRRHPLHLDRDPLALAVTAHQVDRPDVGRPFAADEPELLPEGARLRRELLLQVALDAVLFEPGRLAHL